MIYTCPQCRSDIDLFRLAWLPGQQPQLVCPMQHRTPVAEALGLFGLAVTIDGGGVRS